MTTYNSDQIDQEMERLRVLHHESGHTAEDAIVQALQVQNRLLAYGMGYDDLLDLADKFGKEYARYGTKRLDRAQLATKHRMTTGLVDILANIAKTVHEKDRNDIHVNREVPEVCGPQSYEKLSNITKLRFHALVAKVKDENDKHVKGHWLITRRGGQFLRGEISIPEFAHTIDNKVVERSGALVDIRQLKRMPVEFEQREDVQYAMPPAGYDDKGQGRLV